MVSADEAKKAHNRGASTNEPVDGNMPALENAQEDEDLPALANLGAGTFDDKLKGLPTVDQLDCDLREAQATCQNCRNLKGLKGTALFAKDPKMYQHLLQYRAALRKDRIRAADLSDDPASLEVRKPSK